MNHNGLMLARSMAFLVWMLLGGSAAYWGLQLFARPLATPADALPVSESRVARADLSRLLGSTPVAAQAEPEAPTESRLRLLGVVAPGSERAARSGEGLALIEVDGVARTVRVGARLDGELRLLRVDAKSASLGLAGQAPSQTLQVSPLPAAATGNLAPAAPSPVVLGGAPTVYGQQVAPTPPVTPDPHTEGLPLRRPAESPSLR